LRELLDQLEDSRPVGRPEEDAINLLTSHSAKGLEWPVVIPLGLWRTIGKPPELGLRIITESDGRALVYFDVASLPAETKEARERERLRELVRLFYVTLTRAKRHLVIPWHENFGGGRTSSGKSFAELWAANHLFESLPELDGQALADEDEPPRNRHVAQVAYTPSKMTAVRALPRRVLPHQLAGKVDMTRVALHESTSDQPLIGSDGEEAIDYGLWWHETMEFMPWGGGDESITAYCDGAIVTAEGKGFGERARRELNLLRTSKRCWSELNAARWARLSELAIFAPLDDDVWIDGVVDLVLRDAAKEEVWIIDWKTNRRRTAESEQELLARLTDEYRAQLEAYRTSLSAFFPGQRLRAWIYSSAIGTWTELHLLGN
jgi:ATP-dependent exoDNAse (exonuclease V) beta subunit